MDTKQLNLRLESDEIKELQDLAEACGLNRTALAVILLKSAMKAVQANNNRFPMPLVFTVQSHGENTRVDDGRTPTAKPLERIRR